jgi:HD-GYP domain-containing protein (c-di-GMP phosphodiesterase class II)
VAEFSVAIGHELGLKNPELRILARAALLHDIGKLGIPDSILRKPGPLTAEEWEVMKRHPEMGLDILARVGSLCRESELVLAHHERMDCSGYPRGLEGQGIPLGARIIAVADTYDVLRTDRPYRQARTQEEAIRILREESGRRLYFTAVEALLRVTSPVAASSPAAHSKSELRAAHG